MSYYPILVKDQFAIEAEIDVDLYEEQFDDMQYHQESDNIYELINLHQCNDNYIDEVSEQITEHYEDCKPVWEDGYLSGWWHIHIFNDNLYIKICNNIKPRQMKYGLLNCPFWTNFYKWHSILRNITERANLKSNVDDDWSYYFNSKYKPFCLKTSYYSHSEEDEEIDNHSFEFRVNDVIDGRIYFLYKALILYLSNWGKFKKTDNNYREWLCKWDETSYDSASITKSYREIMDDCYRLTSEDKEVLLYNISLIRKELSKDDIKIFDEYVNERIKSKL